MEGQTPPPLKDVDVTASGPLGFARDVTLGPEAPAVTSDQAEVLRGSLEASGVISPTESGNRMTAEDAQRSRVEKEAAMSGLMDSMEASVETQGQYFIRLGDKIPLTQTQQETRSRILGLGKKTTERQVEVGLDDQRVLILNAVEDGSDNRGRYLEATMVTKDGIKTVKMDEHLKHVGDFGSEYDAIKKLRAGSKPAEGTGFSVSESGGKQIKLGYMNETGEPVAATDIVVSDYNGAEPFSGTREEFQDRVKKSIDQTESPHKAIVEKNSAGIQLAHSAAEMIRTLPPRA